MFGTSPHSTPPNHPAALTSAAPFPDPSLLEGGFSSSAQMKAFAGPETLCALVGGLGQCGLEYLQAVKRQ